MYFKKRIVPDTVVSNVGESANINFGMDSWHKIYFSLRILFRTSSVFYDCVILF
jgi:hypothetical protein